MKKSGFLSMSLVCVGLSFASMFNFVLAAPVPEDGATKCETRENGWQYRCAKDNYTADTIQIINVSNEKVWFDTDKWVSFCGHSGHFLGKNIVNLEPGKSKEISFEAAIDGECREIFIINCRKDSATDQPIVCPDFLKIVIK